MPTTWFYSNLVTQFSEVDAHIPWHNDGRGYFQIKSSDSNSLTTTKELLHIANPTTNNLKMKTNYLYLSDFNISSPDIVSGVEVEVKINRGGRITDETIQLMYSDVFIGDNQASYKLDALSLYGSATNMWGVDLTKTMLENANFGVGVRFQSHPSWPHRESPKIDYIRLRVW